jgi:flagellar motor switch protein FliN/FliY
MTATDTDTVDISRLGVLTESYATPENGVTVEVSSTDEAPAVLASGRAWEIPAGAERLVLMEVGQGADEAVAGIVAHLADALGAAATESTVDSCEPPTIPTVLVLGSAAGPGLVAFVAASGVPVVDRRDEADPDGSGLLSLGMLADVPLEVTAQLGHAQLSVAEILQLTIGSVVELDRTAGAPVDVVVNGSLIARGEVVVIDDEYGIRVTEIVGRIGDAI